MRVVDTPTEASASARPSAPASSPQARRSVGQGPAWHAGRSRDADRIESNRTAAARMVAEHGKHVEQPAPARWGVSTAGTLLDRDRLIGLLDRAVTKRLTLISGPPGSGKTSLLRTWADRSTNANRVAYVSVDRAHEPDQPFWWAVLESIRRQGGPTEPLTRRGAAALDSDQIANLILAELAEPLKSLVLVIDDLDELR
jgi:hypothetical protein